MKKIGIIICALTMSLIISGCTAPKEKFNEEEFLSEIKPNIECLDSCIKEMFLADVDFNDSYYGLYTNEEAYNDGLGTVSVIYKAGEEEKYPEYFADPTQSDYYPVLNLRTNKEGPVSNFSTNLEVRQNLKTYMSDSVLDMWFNNDFLEYDGTLYMRRGSRGYGAVSCDFDSLQYIEEKNGKHYVTVDFLLFEEYYQTETLEFTMIDYRWVITDEKTNE